MHFFAALTLLFEAALLVQAQLNATIPSSKPGYLDVPGASLYYETVGKGPLLLFISGGNGAADIWRSIAMILSLNYKVAYYDRRGFSRSYLSVTEPQDYDHRLYTDVDDAYRLIKHLSNEPAIVLGTSSGAIVALELLIQHPAILRTLVSHEPPAITLLPDIEVLTVMQQEVYTTYRKFGIPAAMLKFATLYEGNLGAVAGLFSGMDPKISPFMAGNSMLWFEREILPYPLHEFNLTAMESNKDLLMLANGKETDPSALQYRTNVVLGQKFGLNVELLAGGHTGYNLEPQAFAKDLVLALGKRGSGMEEAIVGPIRYGATSLKKKRR
ncbi:alpha/beta-hydrolase [Lojkania enalia]|uniref:Alpha/beta-hydrolase n=1 Tax=Lojkania enalia TaxID=147567 RepID=A0A9P4NB77_9PLEO|nr:alpha/beta-hydrolase [Didymosphaeria enalia]